MSLTVGVDSYVTLEDAEHYIEDNYSSIDDYKIVWSRLSNSDKEALLRSSCKAIDGLRNNFAGRVKTFGQKLAFPRMKLNSFAFGYQDIYGEPYQDADLSYISYKQGFGDDGLKAAGEAQIENAVAAANLVGALRDNATDRISGITSKKIGPIAKTYNRNTTEAIAATIGIYTNKVFSILASWLTKSHTTL